MGGRYSRESQANKPRPIVRVAVKEPKLSYHNPEPYHLLCISILWSLKNLTAYSSIWLLMESNGAPKLHVTPLALWMSMKHACSLCPVSEEVPEPSRWQTSCPASSHKLLYLAGAAELRQQLKATSRVQGLLCGPTRFQRSWMVAAQLWYRLQFSKRNKATASQWGSRHPEAPFCA